MSKLNFYFKGVHILLETKDNLLKCYIYNYSHHSFVIEHKDKIIKSEDKNSLHNKKSIVLNRNDCLILEENIHNISINNLVFKLDFEILDTDNESLKMPLKKKSFIENLLVSFDSRAIKRAKNNSFDFSTLKIFQNVEKTDVY